MRHRELASLPGDGEPARQAADRHGVIEHPERPVHDRDGAVVLERHVEPARVVRVPHRRTRVRAERDGSLHLPRGGIDQRHGGAGVIDRSHPGEVGAERHGCDFLPDGDLAADLGVVDVGVRDGPDVAVGRPHPASQAVEDDGRRGRVELHQGGHGAGRRRFERSDPRLLRHACLGGRGRGAASAASAGEGRRRQQDRQDPSERPQQVDTPTSDTMMHLRPARPP